MEELRQFVVDCIRNLRLPSVISDFSHYFYDTESQSFIVQESLHWDYKNSVPKNLESDFGGGILRLICAFYNTYGGIIIFGVDDETKNP